LLELAPPVEETRWDEEVVGFLLVPAPPVEVDLWVDETVVGFAVVVFAVVTGGAPTGNDNR